MTKRNVKKKAEESTKIATDNSTIYSYGYDEVLKMIADYVHDYIITSDEAYQTAFADLADTLGCGILALKFPACTKLLGPVVEGTIVPNGSRVPGTKYILDPIRAAFNIGLMIRWLDFNDTWLAAEWGHPSDNLGGILAVADFLSQQHLCIGKPPLLMHDVMTAMIKAHEIQGGLALLNSFNHIGLDHVILVKVATTAVITHMLGGGHQQIMDAVSQAWIDTGPLRTYRHAPNAGSRKSWAAGDASSRGVFLAMTTMRGEMGYPNALTATHWGFYDTIFQGKAFTFQRPLTSYVMENVLFKVAFPAEFHAQTAVECAIILHPEVIDRLEEIAYIDIETHESALRIIDKKGPLHNPADRDHCLQYMIAIGLLNGKLCAEDYEETISRDARIDSLRNCMTVRENKVYSCDYHDPDKRSIANALKVHFKDGTSTARIEIEYPLGHRRRRKEGLPALLAKCQVNLSSHYPAEKVEKLMALFQDFTKLNSMSVNNFIEFFV